MSDKRANKSIEPNIAELGNGWLKSYNRDYKLEQEELDVEIDKALNDYFSKNGGVGGNRPDTKLLIEHKNLNSYPILIEYKGYKDKLVKLDAEGKVQNRTSKNEPNLKYKFICSKRSSALCKCFASPHQLLKCYRNRNDRVQK